MPSRTSAGLSGPPCQSVGHHHQGRLSFLIFSAWCGLAAGLLEVAAIVLRKRFFERNHLYWMSRHFIWLVPLTNLVIFLVVGGALSISIRAPGGPRGSPPGYWERCVFFLWSGRVSRGFTSSPAWSSRRAAPSVWPRFWSGMPKAFAGACGSVFRHRSDRTGPGVFAVVRRQAGGVARGITLASARRFAKRASDCARHSRCRSSRPLRLWTAHQSNTRPTGHGAVCDSMASGQHRHGPCRRTRVCSPLAGLMSYSPAGSLRLIAPIPPWPNSSARAATRQRALPRITAIVRPTRD